MLLTTHICNSCLIAGYTVYSLKAVFRSVECTTTLLPTAVAKRHLSLTN